MTSLRLVMPGCSSSYAGRWWSHTNH